MRLPLREAYWLPEETWNCQLPVMLAEGETEQLVRSALVAASTRKRMRTDIATSRKLLSELGRGLESDEPRVAGPVRVNQLCLTRREVATAETQ
jgi:hypothetical protein